jgi:hypothetical protein
MPKMTSPPSGVKVRMYRQGHGDCFLLAFAGRAAGRKRNVYVLIDCGLKPKSEVKNQKIDKIIDDINEATGGHIDVVVVTHEHQDHVNGFAKKKGGKHLFDRIKSIGQIWLAWTEDGTDDLANALRERFRDTLVTLAFAQERATGLQNLTGLHDRLSDLLGTEIGDEGIEPNPGREGAELLKAFRAARKANPLAAAPVLAAGSVKGISNKRAIKYLRDRAQTETFLRPDRPPEELPHVKGLKVYALGPPRDEALLLDLDPQSHEEFHLAASSNGMALDGDALGFAQAVAPEMSDTEDHCPLAVRYRIKAQDVFDFDTPDASDAHADKVDWLEFLQSTYGTETAEGSDRAVRWRRIDEEWIGAAEGLALRLNNEVNNTSLVLAFELPKTGKVLLFTGDAQRGSWIGWSKLEWTDAGNKKINARDLLGRCVLYKVGHHGSHNATLNGSETDEYANIGWMARGAFAKEFTAMIPANTPWALNKSQPWVHPLPQIEAALMTKADGRVFRSDKDSIEKAATSEMSDADWAAFKADRVKETDLYFEYKIEDK